MHSALGVDTTITLLAAGGGLLILLGVYLSQKRVPDPGKDPEHLEPAENI